MTKSGIADVSTAGGPGSESQVAGPVPVLTIAAHPSASRVGERAALHGVVAGHEVGVSRNGPDFTRSGRALGQPLGDPFVSRVPIWFGPGPDGGVRLRVDPRGAAVVAGARVVEGVAALSAEELARGVPIELAGRIVLLLHAVEPEPAGGGASLGMIGESAAIRRVRVEIERVADLRVPVLVRGETGTGKELVARAIHDLGPRRDGPFVSVNLGAIPRELAAAELFGAVRGAYTGATHDRSGYFRAAHGGTLFLDEVGEAPTDVQVLLLRVLETAEVYPVGADRPVPVQVRLIAATDADLEEQIRTGRFRAPLLHRLAGYQVWLAPLRERREDIGPLFFHFARQELEAIGAADLLAPSDPYASPWLPAPIASRLIRHPWPGNVRQLHNLTRQLVIGSRGLSELRVDPRLDKELGPPAQDPAGSDADRLAPPRAASRRKPSEVSEQDLVDALRASAWDLKAAADRLRIPRPSIYDLIERSERIRTAGELGADEIARSFHACGGDLDAMVAELEVSKRALARRIKELGLDRTSPPGSIGDAPGPRPGRRN